MLIKFYKLLPRFDEPVKEGKKEAPKEEKVSDKEGYDYKRDSKRSLADIGRELKERAKKRALREQTAKDEPKEEKKVVEEPKVVKDEPKVDVEAVAKRAADEAALRVKTEYEAKLAEILNKDKTIQEKQEEADQLKAIWDKEGRDPKDWKEIASEQIRIADLRAEQREKAREAAIKEKEDQSKTEAEKAKAESDRKVSESKAQFAKQITDDLSDLYEAKVLPKPSKFEEINNPETKDEAALKTQELLNFGVKLNTERVKQGLPPVTSLNKIYFLHYQPSLKATNKTESKQPAGANAPISGARSTTPETSSMKYNYAKDHNKTMAQIAAEIRRNRSR